MGFSAKMPQDSDKALALFQNADSAPFNSRVAQYMTGMILLEKSSDICPNHSDNKQNKKKAQADAISWLIKSANQNWTLAQTRLGYMWSHGKSFFASRHPRSQTLVSTSPY